MFGLSSEKFRGTSHMTGGSDDYDGGVAGVMTGLTLDTKVATAMGWRRLDAVDVGDRVLTFDAGLQTVTKILRLELWSGDGACPRRFWPLEVPAGALGNRDVMHLLPQQSVMVESDASEDLYGDPFSLIPAAALEGVNSIFRVPPRAGFEVVILHFENDQVAFSESGALFFCPSSRDLLVSAMQQPTVPPYSVLPMQEALALADGVERDVARVCSELPAEEIAVA